MKTQQIIEHFKKVFNNTSDLATREFKTKDGTKAVVIWIENVIDQLLLSQNVIGPLQKFAKIDKSKHNIVD